MVEGRGAGLGPEPSPSSEIFLKESRGETDLALRLNGYIVEASQGKEAKGRRTAMAFRVV
jgi:hypothetical protein